ncbi:deoxyribodipyrimidine photo-lyase [uncultured Shimia sp.]|uniref:cryptochrome/photolyase family protein n=1 Tax=uncultured Shimia sp. TaxID=573152 RepID=UPI002601C7EE|nr:deoxyribodipyrimidine photo-lyase [uncultured Shimia sp.]
MPIAIHWFRRDLRLSDNPALTAAAKAGAVLPLYIHDPDAPIGGASKAWLHHSLGALNESLSGHLVTCVGDPRDVLPAIVRDLGAETVTWTRRYDATGTETDTAIKTTLKSEGVEVISANGSLLWEPWEVRKPDGTPYKVFTPFFRKGCMAAPPPRNPLPSPSLTFANHEKAPASVDLDLTPTPRWDWEVLSGWRPGEAGAQARLSDFLEDGLNGYRQGRDHPSLTNVSRLSPHLAFGEISPNSVWQAARAQPATEDRGHFLSELGWREFSYSQLFQNPDIATRNLNAKFDAFPWRDACEAELAWQRGQTGIPIIDAGMRELWQTGYMHNRVRMIVASFLVKNLGLHWRRGLAWFDDTLFDADPANNPASWQWVAGSGADAAPYFRIFNPVTQSTKFDGQGVYIRRFVPELAALPDKSLHAPWETPALVLKAANVTLGETYPHPIADLKESRHRALAAFKALTPPSETS